MDAIASSTPRLPSMRVKLLDQSALKDDSGPRSAGVGCVPVRVVAMSDTHGLHEALGALPDGDILIHCGDFTDKGTAEEVASFDRWLGKQPHQHKVVVGGNHDVAVFAAFDPSRAAEFLPSATHYLDCGHVELCGIRIFGVSWKRQFGAAKLIAALEPRPHGIPAVDILVAHEPPAGTLDGGFGCETMKALMVDPGGCARVSMFGHVHEARGHVELPGARLLVNCAVANDGMRAHSIVAPAAVLELTPLGDVPLSTPEPEPEPTSKRQLWLGQDSLSLDTHCMVVPDAAPTIVVEAAERLSEAIAALSGVRLITVGEGRWSQNRNFHAGGVAGASATRCRTPLVLGCSTAWLVDYKLLSETLAAAIPAASGWVRTVEYVDSEVELEPGESPVQLTATALVVGGHTTASIVAALDWTSTDGLSRLAQGAQHIEADVVSEVAEDSSADEAEGAAPTASLEGQHVEIVNEGLTGVCVKHLVEEGRLRIRLEGDPSRAVWRMADCCVLRNAG